MKKYLAGISAYALGAVAFAAVAQEAAPKADKPMPVWHAVESSIFWPAENTAKSAWEGMKGAHPKPSVDQHLDDPVLHGAIDLHAHFGPDSYPRQWDAFEIAKLMQARGVRGAVFKNHWTESAGLAWLFCFFASPGFGFEAFGGLALDAPTGGVNPQAVRYFADVEGSYARVVWMPTHDAEHEVKFLRESRPFIRVSQDGKLLPPVLEVLDLIKQYHLTLATGHVSPEEMLMITGEAKKRGIDRIIITHPDLSPTGQYTGASQAQLKQAVADGAYVEVVANELNRPNAADIISNLHALGAAHTFISTDSGLTGSPNHTDALVMAAQRLRKEGFTEADLKLMFKDNPAKLVGLPVLQ